MKRCSFYAVTFWARRWRASATGRSRETIALDELEETPSPETLNELNVGLNQLNAFNAYRKLQLIVLMALQLTLVLAYLFIGPDGGRAGSLHDSGCALHAGHPRGGGGGAPGPASGGFGANSVGRAVSLGLWADSVRPAAEAALYQPDVELSGAVPVRRRGWA